MTSTQDVDGRQLSPAFRIRTDRCGRGHSIL